MLKIDRGEPPAELTENVQELLPEQRSYENLSSETRAALKESLLERQGHLCAYCMRRIEDVDHAKLEHLYPQSRSIAEGHLEKTVDYANMLVSCMGGSDVRGRPHSTQTCDSHKGNETISINPCSQSDVDTIRYRRNGEIFSTNPAFDRDLDETLNLNCREAFLPQDRAGVYEAMQRAIEREGPKTAEAKRAFARRKLRALESMRVKEPFMGVMVYRLRRWAR